MKEYDEQYFREITKDEERRDFSYGISNYFRKFKEKKGLDIGCGKGFLVKGLRDIGINAVGIDISEYAVKNRVTEYISQADVTKLPYKDNEFDLVLCIEVLEHLEKSELDECVKEIKRVLKPQGLIFITTPVPNSAYGRRDSTHKSVCAKEQWIRKFEQADFALDSKNTEGLRDTIIDYWTSTKPSSSIGKILNRFGKLRKIAIRKYEERNSNVLAFIKEVCCL